jgi:arylsulfatase
LSNRNVVLITFDALRPDRLSGAGYRGVSTPAFDRVMAEGTNFTTAYCQAPNTWISHASMFTGCNPYLTGVRTPFGKINEGLITMSEAFQQAGYATFGLPAMSLLSEAAGFARGFETYSLEGLQAGGKTLPFKFYRPCSETLNISKVWLEQTDTPFFMWLHYFGIHIGPRKLLELPERYRTAYSEYAQFYDGKVVYADEHFLSPLMAHLENLGLLDETILVLWSDHGEDLHVVEHGHAVQISGHNWGLDEEVMRTLLMIRAPDLLPQGQKRADVCQSIDIFPTLLEATGVELDADQCEGRSLISAEQVDPPVVYMENLCQGFVGIRSGRYKFVLAEPEPEIEAAPNGPIPARVRLLKHTAKAMLPRRWRDGRRSVIDTLWRVQGEPDETFETLLVSGSCELYDLLADPHEKDDLAEERPDLVQTYKDTLREIAARSIEQSSSYMTPEDAATVEEHLRALGYL